MSAHRGHTVLQVPVPGLEPFVRARHQHYDADYVSADPGFVHAHVTVLGPWVEQPDTADLAAVARIAAGTAPFGFVLERVATFPNGIIHLLPEPDDGFRELTTRLTEAFPDHPPYGGEFGEPVPHLTLAHASNGITERSTRAAVTLPVAGRAERVDLAWYEPGGCRLLRSWPLGVRT